MLGLTSIYLVPGFDSPSDISPQYSFHPPTAEEIARRQTLFQTILANREQRRIAPLTSADLVHLAREQEEQRYGEP